jgi:hypothetical protein
LFVAIKSKAIVFLVFIKSFIGWIC